MHYDDEDGELVGVLMMINASGLLIWIDRYRLDGGMVKNPLPPAADLRISPVR
jgi:hypothetical protein